MDTIKINVNVQIGVTKELFGLLSAFQHRPAPAVAAAPAESKPGEAAAPAEVEQPKPEPEAKKEEAEYRRIASHLEKAASSDIFGLQMHTIWLSADSMPS